MVYYSAEYKGSTSPYIKVSATNTYVGTMPERVSNRWFDHVTDEEFTCDSEGSVWLTALDGQITTSPEKICVLYNAPVKDKQKQHHGVSKKSIKLLQGQERQHIRTARK